MCRKTSQSYEHNQLHIQIGLEMKFYIYSKYANFRNLSPFNIHIRDKIPIFIDLSLINKYHHFTKSTI